MVTMSEITESFDSMVTVWMDEAGKAGSRTQ